MYKFLLSFLILFLPFKQPGATIVKWALTKECNLTVSGRTNINKFSCVIPQYIKPDTLILKRSRNSDDVKISGEMKLNVKSFDCHNAIMTKDLRKTMKSDQYPYLIVKFISLSSYPVMGSAGVEGKVSISLSGVTKLFEVSYTIAEESNKDVILKGKKQVGFSDFNIVPPSKLGGMIKTNNKLDVEFVLKAIILKEQ